MKLADLTALCGDAIARWNSGEMIADRPTIMLVVPCATVPKGNGIRLMGRKGPVGEIANIKPAEGGYEALCFYDARAVLKAIAQ